VENYFNYFTEIEDRFLRRRGGGLLLSTLDWALIETWKDAGIPLEAVLRGIDEAFDRYDQRPSKTKKVNSLAYCSQLVLSAAEDMKEAAVGASGESSAPGRPRASQGFEPAVVVPFLRRNADLLEAAKLPDAGGVSARSVTLAVLLASTPDEEIVAVRAEADRDLGPYRRKMSGAQIDQLQKQYVHKRLLEKYHLPRLSLFYM
jgi:hypothetical protein